MTKPVISTNYFRNNSAVLINIACCKVLDPRRQMSQMLCNVVCLHLISRSLDTSGQVIYPHIFPSSPLLINVRSGTVRCARAIINTALSLTNPKHIFPRLCYTSLGKRYCLLQIGDIVQKTMLSLQKISFSVYRTYLFTL